MIDFLYDRIMRHIRTLEAQREAAANAPEGAVPAGNLLPGGIVDPFKRRD